MAVKRQFNFVGQMRFDVPHARSLESAICNDFDVLAGQMIAGSTPYVVTGLTVVDDLSAVGNPAENMYLSVAGAAIMHPTASESGTVFVVAADADDESLNTLLNSKVSGSFQASSVNYVGIDLLRATDDTTSDTVQFLNADTDTEVAKTVPLARTLDYQIVVSTTDFTINSHILPIFKVQTDANNNVTIINDCRQMLFRLGAGGNIPDPESTYTWSNRNESLSGHYFTGGDKELGSFKAWMDAVMTRLWEIGGGEYWYSPCTERDVKMVRAGVVLPGHNEHFYWDLAAPNELTWQGLFVLFTNGTSTINSIADDTVVLLDGQCVYVDLDRSTAATLTAQVADVDTVGLGLPGERFVFAWRAGDEVFTRDSYWAVNTLFTAATTTDLGAVKLAQTALNAASPMVLNVGTTGGSSLNTPAIAGAPTNVTAFTVVGKGDGDGIKGTGGSPAGGSGDSGGVGVHGIGGEGDSPGVSSPGVLGEGLYAGAFGVQGTSAMATGGAFYGGFDSTGQDGVYGKGGDGENPGAGSGGNGVNGEGGTGSYGMPGGRGLRGQGGTGGADDGAGGGTGGRGASLFGGPGGDGYGDGAGNGGIGVKAEGGDGGMEGMNQGDGGDGAEFHGGIGGTLGGRGAYSIGGTGATGGIGGEFEGGGGTTGGIGVKGTGGDSLAGDGGYGGWFVAGGVNGKGLYVSGTGTGDAIKIGTGEIEHVVGQVRHAMILPSQMTKSDVSGGALPFYTGGYNDYWQCNANSDGYTLNFQFNLPARSTITDCKVLAYCDNVVGDEIGKVYARPLIYDAGLGWLVGAAIYDGAAGSGEFTILKAPSAAKWGATGAPKNTVLLTDDVAVQCYLELPTCEGGKVLRVYAVRFTYEQLQISHNI